VKQDFTASAPNKKWVTNFTFIETREGWLFLADVLDVYSRKIVGWSMSDRHDTEFVQAALCMALLQRQPGAGLVHHSDRGSEYASISYQMMLHEQNIHISMSKKGGCYDNTMIESFWATLKEECVGKTIFFSRNEAKTAIFEYIEVYYNRRRRHSSLGYMSPVEYEKQGERKNRMSHLSRDILCYNRAYIEGHFFSLLSWISMAQLLRLSTLQNRVNSNPLYTYSGDTGPGQTTGEGVGGVWHVCTPSLT
jgi:hypothetical protein